MHSIRISKPNKRIHLTLSLSTFGVQAFVSLFVSVWCSSSTIVPGCCQKKKGKKIALTCCECSVSIVSALSLRLVFKPLSLRLLLLHHYSRLPPPKKKKKSITLTCCECSVSIVSTNRIKAPPLFHLHHCEYSVFIFPFFYVVSALIFFFFFTFLEHSKWFTKNHVATQIC